MNLTAILIVLIICYTIRSIVFKVQENENGVCGKASIYQRGSNTEGLVKEAETFDNFVIYKHKDGKFSVEAYNNEYDYGPY